METEKIKYANDIRTHVCMKGTERGIKLLAEDIQLVRRATIIKCQRGKKEPQREDFLHKVSDYK